ncbi:hypothetical protein HY504_00090 [Candidatus Wolfebacteria bacterium]|nr:hypothetical protein [Candidatus Wolfebacteria bacterium]
MRSVAVDMLQRVDYWIIGFLRTINLPAARGTIFVVFFWFGLLKVVATSPANPLVAELLGRTLPFVTFNQFIIGFGIYEMMIGVIFLIPGLERLAIALLVPHMATTFLPLIVTPAMTWQSFMVPTLEGQYIIKNLVIIAAAIAIAAHLHPLKGVKAESESKEIF